MGRAALQPLVVPQKRKSGHQFAAVVPAMEHGQHPADGPGQPHQRFGLVAGAHDDGTVQLIAPLTEVLPRVERAHAVAQQEIGHAGIQLLCQGRHSVQVLQHGAVAVGFAEVAIILFGADGPAVAQVVVAGDKDAPGGQILGQRLIAVDELHHPVGELGTARTSPSGTQRNAWSVRPGWQDGRVKSIIWLMGCLLLRIIFSCCRSSCGRRCRCSSLHTGWRCRPPRRRNRSCRWGGTF